jgi:hypothetical protein
MDTSLWYECCHSLPCHFHSRSRLLAPQTGNVQYVQLPGPVGSVLVRFADNCTVLDRATAPAPQDVPVDMTHHVSSAFSDPDVRLTNTQTHVQYQRQLRDIEGLCVCVLSCT